jgi:hypothetical protein
MLSHLSFGHERIPFGEVDNGTDAGTALDSDGNDCDESMEGSGERTSKKGAD